MLFQNDITYPSSGQSPQKMRTRSIDCHGVVARRTKLACGHFPKLKVRKAALVHTQTSTCSLADDVCRRFAEMVPLLPGTLVQRERGAQNIDSDSVAARRLRRAKETIFTCFGQSLCSSLEGLLRMLSPIAPSTAIMRHSDSGILSSGASGHFLRRNILHSWGTQKIIFSITFRGRALATRTLPRRHHRQTPSLLLLAEQEAHIRMVLVRFRTRLC
jgi:hypothetical protein